MQRLDWHVWQILSNIYGSALLISVSSCYLTLHCINTASKIDTFNEPKEVKVKSTGNFTVFFGEITGIPKQVKALSADLHTFRRPVTQ